MADRLQVFWRESFEPGEWYFAGDTIRGDDDITYIARPPDREGEFDYITEPPPGPGWEVLSSATANIASFTRAFGPDTPTPVPASAWTRIILDPAGEPWRVFGTECWQAIVAGDPDYAQWGGCIRCLREGVYDLVGAAIFDSANQTGDRAISIIEEVGPYANQWALAASQPMPKVANGGVIVAGETYQYVNNIVSLRAWSSVATQTTSNIQGEWMSAAYLGKP